MIRTTISTSGRRGRPGHMAASGLIGALAVGMLLAGCSGSSETSSAPAPDGARAPVTGKVDSGVAAGTPAPASGQDIAGGSAALSPADANKAFSTVLPGLQDRSIIRTANLSVRVKDVLASAGKAETLAAGAGGFVAGEQTQADPDQPDLARAVLTLRVPGPRLPQLLGDLGRLGALISQDQAASDVTAEVIDVQARIASQQASVNRIRALLGQAKTIGQVVQIEGELANREGALESLKGQSKALADQTSLATVTATLVGLGAAPPVVTPAETGFGHGLKQGWKAFTTATNWLLTALGAVLPFLIIGVPLLWVLISVRRRRGGHAAPVSGPEAA
jgi:hypothetical protein